MRGAPVGTDSPPRPRSTERSDGRDGGTTPTLQPTPIVPVTVGWLDAPRPRSSERDAPRESPATAEGLGPIVLGGAGRQGPNPPPSTETRSSSFNPIRRAITAITGMGRSPQPTDSQADVEQTADIEHIEVEDSPDESAVVEEPLFNPEPASAITETPVAATETASGASQEPIVIEENSPKASTPPRPKGRMDAVTGSKGEWYNPLKNPIQPVVGTTLPQKKQTPAEPQEGQAPETQSYSMSNESAPPQTSEAAPSQEAQEER